MIKEVFNTWSREWDSMCRHNEMTIRNLIKIADITEYDIVLDIGCGTGILEKYLLEKSPAKITAVDFAAGMIEVAKEKYKNRNIDFRAMDIYDLDENEKFDKILMYNVFPHFLNQEAIIEKCSKHLKPNGRIMICHGSSRDRINNTHNHIGHPISVELRSSGALKELMNPYFEVDCMIDNDRMYAVSGKIKCND